VTKAEAALARIAPHIVAVPHGCWLWVGRSLTSDGYAKLAVTRDGRERTVRVHRWLVEQLHGPDPLPADVVTAHACNETICVNARDHVRAVTQRTNLQQMAREGRAAGRAHQGLADLRGALGRARALQAALRGGLDLDALAAAMREGDPRPLVRQALAHGYDADAYLEAVAASDPTAGQLPLF
jgi:hypothetical protein